MSRQARRPTGLGDEYTPLGMTGQLADFLSVNPERIAEIWAKTAGVSPDLRGAAATRGPRQFLNAVLIALSADDLEPLMAFYELDAEKAVGLEKRLDRALQELAAVRSAAIVAAQEAGMDTDSRLSLAVTAAEEIGAIASRVSVLIAERLATQVSTVTSSHSSRGTSLSITMHELRRPLTILSSYGQLLSAGMLGQMPETAMVAIEGITASTEMMVRMVNALAELSRLEDPDDHLTLESMSLSELISGSIETVSMEARLRECAIEPALDADVTLRGDRRRLTLALTNILGNAVKHAPNGSTIWVRGWENEDQVHVSVRDEGPGFPPGDAEHLFEKYYRSVAERHRKVPGSGLGLYIVKTVAERHNGTVTAHSEPGRGAEFELAIPRNEKAR